MHGNEVHHAINIQPVRNPFHIIDYLRFKRRQALVAPLMSPASLDKLKDPRQTPNPLFHNAGGLEGRDWGKMINQDLKMQAGRWFAPPIENEREIAQFKELMRQQWKENGLHAFLTFDMGAYDRKHDRMMSLDKRWMAAQLRRLVDIYGDEPWVIAFGLGNENERFINAPGSTNQIRVNPEKYYELMNFMAGIMKDWMKTRKKAIRPVVSGPCQLLKAGTGLISGNPF